MPLKPMKYNYNNKSIFPLKPCKLDGHDFKCPVNPRAHLAAFAYKTDVKDPDHVWNKAKKDYIALTEKMDQHHVETRTELLGAQGRPGA